MKVFLHTLMKIRIIGDLGEFECDPARFLELEPDYIGLPAGVTARYWSEENAYFEGGVEYDGHECGAYCDRVLNYTQYPEIFADVRMSKALLNSSDPLDVISFTASLQDEQGVIVPLKYDWHIKLTHDIEGDIDRIMLSFDAGTCAVDYALKDGLPLGSWKIDEEKFTLVEFGGILWRVRLVSPVEFVVYRTL